MKQNRLPTLALAAMSVLFLNVANAETFTEDFSSNPASRGWSVFGDSSLFLWDSTNSSLLVTWDSSRTNSYFHRPLGTIITTNDDFSLAFDLRLNDIGPGPDGLFSFELAIGFLNFNQAVQTNFLRGYAGFPGQPFSASNLVEFAYFWDSGFGATVWPSMVDTNNYLYTANGSYSTNVYVIHELNLGDWYRITMNYTASNRTLVTTITNASQTDIVTIISPLGLDNTFADFRADTISINSYSDNDGFGGSVLAHGVVDHFVVTTPPPPVENLSGAFSNSMWQAQFISRSNWLYTLQRTTDFQSWTDVPPAIPGNATNLFLQDTNSPADKAFYRIKAERP